MFPYQCCDLTPPLRAAVPTDHDAQLLRKPLETKENRHDSRSRLRDPIPASTLRTGRASTSRQVEK